MKKNLSAKLNSYLSLQALLVGSKSTVAALPALEEAVDGLVDFILEINLNVKIQASPSGAADAKRDALITLGDAAYSVAGSVLSYADKHHDLLLAAKVKFPRSGITAGSANAVVARCQGVIDAATENLAALGDHGVTTEKLKVLKQALKLYDAVRVLPRDAIGAAGAATKALDRIFPQVDRLLNNQMDRLVWQFRETTPDFYDKYQTARSIVDAPTPSAEDEPSATAEDTKDKAKTTTAATTDNKTTLAAPRSGVVVNPTSATPSEPAASAAPGVERNGTPASATPEAKSP